MVLVDWDTSGLDVAKTIRRTIVAGADPVIFLVTAYSREEILISADRAGIDVVLTKPVNASVLLETIASAFLPRSADERAAASAPVAESALADTHVLLVEDNAINQEVALSFLSDLGVTSELAENGAVAVAKVLEEPTRFDAVLMDIQMPVMDGIEASRRIRVRIPPGSLPIIAMTAHVMAHEQQRFRDAGMDDHIAKPVDPLVLAETLKRWVKPRSGTPSTHAPPREHRPLDSGEGLPDTLPPFDIPAALRRLGGERFLLHNLFAHFHRNYAGAVTDLRLTLAHHDYGDAERIAHTVAGIAAQLEAGTLAEAARAIEQKLREGHRSVAPEALDAFESGLREALEAVATLVGGPDLPRVVAASTTANGDVERATLAEEMREIRELLRRNSFKARKSFADLQSAFRGTQGEHYAHTIAAQLAALDYKGAELTLDTLMLEVERG